MHIYICLVGVVLCFAKSEGMDYCVWVCRRDMNQKDLTEQGMRQGVKDSDIFILFLTNSVLSRYANALDD